MKRRVSIAVLALAMLVLPGCYAMDIDATALEPHVYLTSQMAPGQSPERLGDFDTKVTGSWALWGLLKLKDPNIGGAMEQEIRRAGGTGAINVEIVTQRTVVDSLLALITLGLYGQRSTMISGTVVR